MLEGKTLLLFDFDGTVADTSHLHASAFREVLKAWDVSLDYSKIAGLSTKDALRVIADDAAIVVEDSQLDALARQKQLYVRTEIASGLIPIPGVDRFLHKVRDAYRVGMVTSGSRETIQISLQALGYLGIFDPLVTADDVPRSKPDPVGYLMALDRAACLPSAALVFEDADAGVLAAQRAGLSVCDVRIHPFCTALAH